MPLADPALAAYDHGCGLVEGATGLRRVATGTAVQDAVPAVLGCIESALRELSTAAAGLAHAAPAGDAGRRELTDGLTTLEVALNDAAEVATVARALAARVAAQSAT
jgi:hypothetical protein